LVKFESIAQYHTELLNGTHTCVSTVQHFLFQIKAKKHLNAFVEVYEQEALERAVQLDRQQQQTGLTGKLHGVVIALKDVICYKDHKVTASSAILSGFTSIYSATAVNKLLEAGAIIIGNTNCDEFAMGSTNESSCYGRVLNAVDETMVPGGSSGGSAVAVQAGLCMISLGSDTGGSVRQPADFCGIVGLKPSYGAISRYGLIAYASSFDQIGIFAGNVPDTAQVLEVISGPDEFDSTLSPDPVTIDLDVIRAGTDQKLRVAYFDEALNTNALDPEIRKSIFDLIGKLRAEGHTVEPVTFEYLDYIVPAYYVLTTAEASSNLSRFDGIKYGFRNVDKNNDLTDLYKKTRSEGFGREVKRRIMLGTFVLSAGYFEAYFTKAQQVRQLLVQKTNMIFNDFDVLLLPTSPTTAFPAGEKTDDPIAMYLADIFTVFSNLTGIPGISIPLFWHSNGLPYGVQAMTNRFCELSLLQLAHQWMQQYRTPR
jgi:aspartyl-tRNA(Asn)/glutamyl-tRNA(Gln) amidotransferase subunit A